MQTGTCHQWCIPSSSGFRVCATSYPSSELGWPSQGWSSPDSRPSSYPWSVPLGKDQGHTIRRPRTTLPELGGSGAWKDKALWVDSCPGSLYVSPGPLLLSPGDPGPVRCTRVPAPDISFRCGGLLSHNGSAGTTGGRWWCRWLCLRLQWPS